MDDDNYVNVRALLKLLASYPHTQDIYLGKPSLDRPIQATERVSESKVVSVPPTQACAERGGAGGVPAARRGRVWEPHHVPPPAAARPLLVCHRRGWLLHQPGAGPEDEPLGQVSGCLGAQARLPQIARSPHWGPALTHLPSTSVPNLTCTGRVSRPTTAHSHQGGQHPGWAGPLPVSGNPQLTENHLAGTEEGAVLGLREVGSCQRESPLGTQAGHVHLLLGPGQGDTAWWAPAQLPPRLTPALRPSHSGGHFMSTAERIRLPDDCTIGYIVEALLGVPLIRSGLFHSHLENLQQVPASELHEQVRCLIAQEGMGAEESGWERREGAGWGGIGTPPSVTLSLPLQVTLSYGMFENKRNAVHIKGPFSVEADPSR